MFRIALTTGCPAGVGPEIAVSAAHKMAGAAKVALFGSRGVICRAAALRGVTCPKDICDIGVAVPDTSELEDAECGAHSFLALKTAAEAVLAGEFDALVTCPINKHHWSMAGIEFPGHTEFLAHLCGAERYAMAFVAPQIVVTLATTHIPLRDVPDALTTEKIVTAAALTNDFLAKKFAAGTERRERPCIAVCGLNPHCGDGGIFGSEEEKIIYPAIEELSSIGIDAAGPCPADSVFFRALKGEFDAVVAMYHDQGLAVVKTLANETAVNVTLGLPIIRTSVDHGTAEDIAWKGVASDANLIAAIEMAIGLKGWV